MDLSLLTELASDWREESELLRRRGAVDQAQTLESVADDFEARVGEWWEEPLGLQEAAEESGYSPDRLGALIREGTVPNAGQKHSPAIRRCDLPRKPGHRSGRSEELLSGRPRPIDSPLQMARSVVNSTQKGGHDG